MSFSDAPPTAAPESYARLTHRMREISMLGAATSALQWDAETYQPKKGVPWRAEQFAFLGGLRHRMFTAPEIGDWLKASEDHGFADDSTEAANVRGLRRDYDRATKLPAELVEELAKTKGLAHLAWQDAKKHSDFARFRPNLEHIFTLSRRMADAYGWEGSRYNALLEGWEPGATVAELRALFDSFRPRLRELLPLALEKSRSARKLEGDFPAAQQAAFNAEVARAIGFDFDAGRIDVTAHPFCSHIAPYDCRLTTRYDERNFAVSFSSVMHECGHGMYELGLDQSAFGLPVGSAESLGLHESQSRLWENQVGRSREFWEHWFPRAAHHLPALRADGWTPETVWAALNRVSPSFIRVEADQLTYDLHIMLRFDIERRLLEGELDVADAPAAWNEEFERSLGLKVPDDAHGCLQDVHWCEALIGYFPTYSLGNLNAAQLFAAAKKQDPAITAGLARAEYAPLLSWLRENVHRHGAGLSAGEIMRRATGEPTKPDAHLAMLAAKFSA